MADPDHALRLAANEAARRLSQRFEDLVPLRELRAGFHCQGRRISFGSFQRGIHRPKEMQGAAALTLTTAPPVPGKPPPYDDRLDSRSPTIRYAYRAGDIDQPDNRALRAACAESRHSPPRCPKATPSTATPASKTPTWRDESWA